MPRTQWRHLQCPSSARPHRHVPLRLGLRVWGRGGGAQRALAPPHTPLPWCRPRLPSSRLWTSWRGSSGRISWAVRRDGWWLPAAGPLACPLPPAAGPGPVCLGRSSVVRCSGPAVRSPVTSPCPPSLGACSQPCFPTRAAAVLSGSLALSPPYLCCVPCPLGTTLPFGAPSLCPWWSGEKGAWGTRRGPRWLRGEVVGGGCGRMGGDFFLIKSLIKKFIPSIYSVLKHHTYCTGSAWKGPPLSRTATDSTMKGQQGALPLFSAWVAFKSMHPTK